MDLLRGITGKLGVMLTALTAAFDRNIYTRSVAVDKKADRTEYDVWDCCRTEPPKFDVLLH